VPYHVSLELTAGEVTSLRMAALKKQTTVKGFVTDLVKGSLGRQSGKPVAGSGSRGKVSAKSGTKE
jgi:hypothetical protein